LAVLALSSHLDPRFVAQALASGAKGYVSKDRVFEELVDAVRAVARCERYVSPAIEGTL
jgi:DNA-binding NarL/FixJ family response regulator